ncbi:MULTISPECIES: acyl-CoA dehydrogenase [unclassified Novosphingobium]|uniref:acyl-CoA dehydrogenase family protein n=1 Tax=unclassified Novosphingobium TaxID=2644732 RepID=UPI0014483D3C|nr:MULTISPECIES: acyl-CoA dehydrogenase [unclassified Novosphingobium]NKJ44883.1 alkylation response protein AidB-like acyl-CoA dehydrogenase [Novosphingobium sp. SG720]NMN07467.1 alkylation response protein AidB-like acyl-CoA dehydrogenase [Novosphingobium sp. SG919]NMN89748.1 alkylation response protein AidB-like acyl-CoA dehydrogenase [Novosphingobium sp. SG916]
MYFHHSEDRQMLADMLGRYLQQRYPFDIRNKISASPEGWSRTHWAELAELGVVGALFGEGAGGFGGTGFDIAAVFEGLGKALVVEPFLGTLMAGQALAMAAGKQDALLAEVIAGTTLLAFAHEEPQSRYDVSDVETQALPNSAGWALQGCKAVVPQIEAADRILVSARIAGAPGDEAGIGLFLVDKAAARLRGYPMVDGGRGGELVLDNTPATLVAKDGFPLIEQAIAAGIVALAWEAVAVMDVLKTTTLDYLRTRRQFGVPIGKFQALQHRMATVALEIELARSAAISAADALGQDRRTRERAVSAAKYTIGRVGTLVAEESIQMHGGIGMTWELPLSHYAKRLTMIGHQLGDEDHHLERFIALGHA